jgi:plasmid stabilization system protein ParE
MASNAADDAPVEYDIEYAESAELDLESAYLFRSATTSPESAARWVDSLRAKAENLRFFPHGNSRAQEYESSGKDVRRMLHQPYRILYLILSRITRGITASSLSYI